MSIACRCPTGQSIFWPRFLERASLFPGERSGCPLSNMALLMTLRRMGCADVTVHGFRKHLPGLGREQTAIGTRWMPAKSMTLSEACSHIALVEDVDFESARNVTP